MNRYLHSRGWNGESVLIWITRKVGSFGLTDSFMTFLSVRYISNNEVSHPRLESHAVIKFVASFEIDRDEFFNVPVKVFQFHFLRTSCWIKNSGQIYHTVRQAINNFVLCNSWVFLWESVFWLKLSWTYRVDRFFDHSYHCRTFWDFFRVEMLFISVDKLHVRCWFHQVSRLPSTLCLFFVTVDNLKSLSSSLFSNSWLGCLF